MITRRRVVLAGGASLLVAHPLGRGQSLAPSHRVGLLVSGSKAATANVGAAFKQGMQDLGWLEGNNVEYRFAYADGVLDRLDPLAVELVGQKVEVIVVGNVPSVRAVQRATKVIPIVMTNVNNALGNGFVASLAKPGGNITGITTQAEEVMGKLFGILHEVAPGARRIAVLLNESNPNHAVFWAAAQSACASLDLVALRIVASTPAQFGAASEQIVRQRSQAVVVVADGMYYPERTRLQEAMQITRLPVAYQFREHVAAGGLLSYGADVAANNRHAAKYVDRILKGARPADLPVEQPNKFDLAINLKTAKALGITIPQSLLLRADEVIQ
jgi:putative tryptophan/tyrosine transport system substrate-binding protein